MKLFIGAAKDRLEALLAAPTSSPASRLRPFALVALLLLADAGAATALAAVSGRLGWRRALLFAFDAASVAAEGCKVLLRCAARAAGRFQTPTPLPAHGNQLVSTLSPLHPLTFPPPHPPRPLKPPTKKQVCPPHHGPVCSGH